MNPFSMHRFFYCYLMVSWLVMGLPLSCLFAQEGLPVPADKDNPNALFISKQTKKGSMTLGQYEKKTDQYEHGSVKLDVKGPITYTVLPEALSIKTNSQKAWNGTLLADVNAGPEPGKMAKATLSATYDWTFSRAVGSGKGGKVLKEQFCQPRDHAGNNTCPYHPKGPGKHEIVNFTGLEEFEFEVYSLFLSIGDIGCEPSAGGDTLHLHADVFPSGQRFGGRVIWTLPDGSQVVGNNIDVFTGKLENEFNISATYDIQGITFTDSKTIKRNKLIDFKLPCCIDDTVKVEDIAILKFDGPCHPPVEFNPPKLKPPFWLPYGSYQEKVTATCNGTTLEATTTTVDNDRAFSYTPVVIDVASRIFRGLQPILNTTQPGVKIDTIGSIIPKGTINLDLRKNCCLNKENDCVWTKSEVSGNLAWNYGRQITLPIPFFTSPYFFSPRLIASVKITGNISANAEDDCFGKKKICVKPNIGINFSAGVGAQVASGVLSIDLQAVSGIRLDGEVCIAPPPLSGNLSLSVGPVKLQGIVTMLWGFSSISVEDQIFDGYGPIYLF
jgi:hypothetical protein